MASDPESWESVGERLERIREALADLRPGGMNKSQIAHELGISSSQWTNYINGTNLIPMHTAVRLCRIAGVTTDYIYRDTIRSVVDPELAARLMAKPKPNAKQA
jgi:transcriptional regulator with XRE-family HTH domain